MDDLVGIDWSAPSKPPPPPTSSTPTSFAHRPTPPLSLSGRSTPLSAQQSGAGAINKPKIGSKPATPANDSFASLVTRNSSKPATSNLSLQERQRQLQQEKLKQEAERRKQYETHFGGADSQFWDTLGSGKNTPEATSSILQRPTVASTRASPSKPFDTLGSASSRPTPSPQPDDDILAAFNSAAPVDSSSHFPPSASLGNRDLSRSPATTVPVTVTPPVQAPSRSPFEDDDDLFGLGQLAAKNSTSNVQATSTAHNDDDDILGLLGKPVSEFQTRSEPVAEERLSVKSDSPDLTNPQAKAVAELVDMGFPANKSAVALATTESGLDVQAAVSYLLNQAHAQAKQKSRDPSADRPRRTPTDFDDRPRRANTRGEPGESRRDGSTPAWMRGEDGRSSSAQRRQDGKGATQDKDVTQYATEIGSTLFKSANSLWKTGRKQVQKAVADFQQDGDPNVPKWMKNAGAADAGEDSAQASKPRRDGPLRAVPSVTDEAMLLESGERPNKPPRASESHSPSDYSVARQGQEQRGPRDELPRRDMSRSPAFQQRDPRMDKRPAARLTRHEVEEQTSQAYISPARRKKITPQPDLFTEEKAAPKPTTRQPVPPQSKNPFLQAASTSKSSTPRPSLTPPRPKAPPRQIPPVSASALNSSAMSRQKGTEAFKRGDYTVAHAAYSSALSPLPSTHPVTIIVLCNRAVTNIKVGDPKAAVADADAALAIIGMSKGDGEKIQPGGTESEKDMKEFYGKALMRKAEALEHMEKWAEAGRVWRTAVEAGVGGAISIQGRNRCDKAAGGGDKPATPAAAKRPPVRKAPPPKVSALADLGGAPTTDSEAVRRLKEANAAAEKADDEKFALTDQVDAKLVAWKGTKADNLRALLGSLDKVLWPEAGWKKVNMGDLVLSNKVKIIYMKAIAKVHPDKISQASTTEQRMLSAAIFATLNEAWDKFKTENGM